MRLMNEKRLITVEEMTKIISLPGYTIRRLIQRGVIPAYRPTGKAYLMDPTEVIEAIKNHG